MNKFNNTLDILLEADHRKTMVNKMEIPQNLADFLHQFSSKHSIWFANQIVKIPNYEDIRPSAKLAWVQTSIRPQMTAISDWVRGEQNVNLRQYDWAGALQAAEEWHQRIAAEAEGKLEPIEIPDSSTLIKQYDDGFYWLDLNTRSCGEEGSAMGHCGTTNMGDTLFSLRSQKGAHVTMAISPDEETWYQCKGKGNAQPHEKYHKYIANILAELGVTLFKPEYNSQDDFNDETFREYVSANPDEFDNASELQDKIEDSGYAAFQKAEEEAEEYNKNFEHGYVSITYDEYAYADAGYTITLEGVELLEEIGWRNSAPYKEILDVSSEEVDVSEHAGNIDVEYRMNYDGYNHEPSPMVEELASMVEDLEQDYAENRAKLAELMLELGHINELPFDLKLVDQIRDDDEDLWDAVDNDGIQVFSTSFRTRDIDDEEVDKFAEALIKPVNDVIDSIVNAERGEQTEFNFESYRKAVDVNENFTLVVTHSYLMVGVRIYFKPMSVPKSKENFYLYIVKYLRKDRSFEKFSWKIRAIAKEMGI